MDLNKDIDIDMETDTDMDMDHLNPNPGSYIYCSDVPVWLKLHMTSQMTNRREEAFCHVT
jgi:hypothetical protein